MYQGHEIWPAANIESLWHIVVVLCLESIDKPERQSLVDAISKARKFTPKDLIIYLSEVKVEVVCVAMDVTQKFRWPVLIEQLSELIERSRKLVLQKSSEMFKTIVSIRKIG